MIFPRHKKLILYVVILFFMSFFLFFLTNYYQIISPIIPKDGAPVIISLDRTASASQFVKTLKDKKLIHSGSGILLMIRFSGLSSKLKAGVYQIKPGETAMQLIGRVVAGDVLTQNFTIIAGTTQQKISQDLAKAPYLNYRPTDWDSIKDNHPNAEGLLLADTYQYRGGSNGKSLLEHAHQNLMNYLNRAWSGREPNLPYKTPYELLTAASIIEKETAIPQERKLISGVMVNRLNKKMPLQMDPTVIYGLGSAYNGKLSHNDLLIDSPYNSYHYRGLPPTPIAMVGKEALDAAAHPQLSNYLYFVAKGDGTHQFSETYQQQKQAINQYKRKEQ
ncbi:endolytic transglycosylase MltG [Fluoribacter dumoffii]|uniref:Endolytic murein transglycosylase n=1 Tax=Fluoribacter dumoffii TaxID=463 RepID=A0A377GAG3_9GAMM|nr:endolytic transglycosylase MltG [Fluoribacter dumoffii]KTC88997.1 periplasmic solute-binding protein [Fluoribacter dumoffii NY 23]MCW8385791.1 endolytic transglycosylase MltG [Fluoribacter dumoffii]MCW8418824.1 endolytic transglycosylase MltG [Fluoribacter dumoffii]MCW8453332.1 endolytic transglycosylase MltG [Fluoribacter dumoffii]MCW8459447.1 endolytic transglycosylase MltG [Fluoribacter dumoffii]